MARQIVDLDKPAEAQAAVRAAQEAVTLAAEKLAGAVAASSEPERKPLSRRKLPTVRQVLSGLIPAWSDTEKERIRLAREWAETQKRPADGV